jgi:hypothetical protein
MWEEQHLWRRNTTSRIREETNNCEDLPGQTVSRFFFGRARSIRTAAFFKKPRGFSENLGGFQNTNSRVQILF